MRWPGLQKPSDVSDIKSVDPELLRLLATTDLNRGHNIPVPIPPQGNIQPPHNTERGREHTTMDASIKVHSCRKQSLVTAYTKSYTDPLISQNTGARLIASFLQITPLMKYIKHPPPLQNACPRTPMCSTAVLRSARTVGKGKEKVTCHKTAG